MVWKLDGVAFLGLHEDAPRTIDSDRCGRPCEGDHVCATGAVCPISYAGSCAEGAAAIYAVMPGESTDQLGSRIEGERLQYQSVVGALNVVQVGIPALVADDRGRGEPPWDHMAELDEDVAIELGPRVQGIRELRLRQRALDRLQRGRPTDYMPASHVGEILAAARRAA